MKPQTILIFSLVCNLGLASITYRYLRPNGAQSKDSATSRSSAKESSKDKANQLSKSTPVRKLMVTNYNSDEFTWHNIEAQDYKDYIANLRSVDCPEETIRDIIVADVNKLYAGKQRRLRGETDGEYKYWKGSRDNWNSKEGYERQKKYQALEKEKSALLVELLGVDPNKERNKEMGYGDYRERNFSFLPEEKKQQVRDIQEKFEEQRQELYRNGIYDAEDQKALKKVYEAQLAEMAKVLTPQELEEYDLRASQTANQLRYDLDGFEPTENEFRQIYASRKAREDDLAYSYDPDDKAAQERRKKASEEVDQQIKAQMGEARFAEYKINQDYNYKELTRLADRLELPKGTAVAVYDMKKAAEDEVKKVREDKTLTNEQRTQALQAIRTETEKAVTESLGESVHEKISDPRRLVAQQSGSSSAQQPSESDANCNHCEVIMKKLILISILLNLGLVGVIAHFATQRKAQPAEASIKDSASTDKSAKGKRSVKKEVVMVNAKGEKFSWRDVESEDYKKYIANLRVIQCPEETVRDIIIADVNKFYAEKLKPLRKPIEEFKFWKNENNWGGRRESEEFYAAQRDIEKEKRALLKELLGADYEKEMAKQYGWDNRSADTFNDKFSQETKDQLAEISKKFGEKQSEIYRKAKGYIDQDTQEELKKLDKERRAEMAKVLSPEDLFEWDLRNSSMAQNMKYNELQGFDANEDEYRAIFKAKLTADDAGSSGDEADKATRDERMKAQKEAQDALKETLGEDRYKEYQMAQIYEYRELMRIADKQGVAKEDVAKVYDMKADVEKAARAINADKTLTPEVRREKLLAIKQMTEQEVTGTLGDRGFKAWKRNAWWLRNIIPPEPTKPSQ